MAGSRYAAGELNASSGLSISLSVFSLSLRIVWSSIDWYDLANVYRGSGLVHWPKADYLGIGLVKSITRTLLSVGGAIALLTLGELTLHGPIPALLGLPVLLVAVIAYGIVFEKALLFTCAAAMVLLFLSLGIELYPDYATQPLVILVYLVVATAAIAWAIFSIVPLVRSIDREKQENRDREERDAIARRLVEEKNISPRADEPLPPWIKFPGYAFTETLERFGDYGPWEEYRDKEWGPFWRGLTINQRHEYFLHYDLGDKWTERGDWSYHWVTWEKIEEYSDYLVKLVEEAKPETRESEPTPPWIKYPELADATSEWSHGKGADYLLQTFYPFFNTLSGVEKANYLTRHDLGLGWDDRDEWMRLIGAERDITE